MKKLFCLIAVLSVVLASALPASAADLSGGYWFTADCALGYDMRFYVPTNAASGSLTLNQYGYLFNLTNSTIYLYCPDYPGYSFYASRFDVFYYRVSTDYGSTAQQLSLNNIQTNNVDIFYTDPVNDPAMDIGFLELLHVMLDAASFAVAFILLLKWGDKHV